jgi:Protein of unknown function (DUF3667)
LRVSLFLIKIALSHGKIRTEKKCLNCGTETTGRYCSACGQENIEPKQTVWHLVTHFFSDITHFDGKFFVTVKDLFAKPGFLSREYMIGRRASYLDPVRMYIFTSAFFFLIFFSLFDVKHLHIGNEARGEIRNDPDLRVLMARAKTAGDSLRILNAYDSVASRLVRIAADSSQLKPGFHTKLDVRYRSIAAYDSSQKLLPPSRRDNWIKRKITIWEIDMKQRLETEPGNLLRELIGNFMHNFPKMLFISLPAFALLLKLLYSRQKQFYYVDHGIFSIHLYIFSFLLLLVYFGLNELRTGTGWNWLGWIIAPVLIYPFFYYYKAMRRFYGQGRGKTIWKYILLLILSFIVLLFIFVCFALLTVFEI